MESFTCGASLLFLSGLDSSGPMKALNPEMPRSSGSQGPLQSTASREADLWRSSHQQTCPGGHCRPLRSTAAHQQDLCMPLTRRIGLVRLEGSTTGGRCAVTPLSQNGQHDLIRLDHWLQTDPHRAALLSRSHQHGVPPPKHGLKMDSLVAIVRRALAIHLLSGCRRGLLML